jgi:hypothetical protein
MIPDYDIKIYRTIGTDCIRIDNDAAYYADLPPDMTTPDLIHQFLMSELIKIKATQTVSGQVAEAEVVFDNDPTKKFQAGDVILIWLGFEATGRTNQKVFSGIVYEAAKTSDDEDKILTLRARDWSFLLLIDKFTQSYPETENARQIVLDILGDLGAPTVGFCEYKIGISALIESSSSTRQLDFDGEPLIDSLTKVSDATEHDWYIDEEKMARWFKRRDTTFPSIHRQDRDGESPSNLILEREDLTDYNVTDPEELLCNKVKVYGRNNKSIPWNLDLWTEDPIDPLNNPWIGLEGCSVSLVSAIGQEVPKAGLNMIKISDPMTGWLSWDQADGYGYKCFTLGGCTGNYDIVFSCPSDKLVYLKTVGANHSGDGHIDVWYKFATDIDSGIWIQIGSSWSGGYENRCPPSFPGTCPGSPDSGLTNQNLYVRWSLSMSFLQTGAMNAFHVEYEYSGSYEKLKARFTLPIQESRITSISTYPISSSSVENRMNDWQGFKPYYYNGWYYFFTLIFVPYTLNKQLIVYRTLTPEILASWIGPEIIVDYEAEYGGIYLGSIECAFYGLEDKILVAFMMSVNLHGVGENNQVYFKLCSIELDGSLSVSARSLLWDPWGFRGSNYHTPNGISLSGFSFSPSPPLLGRKWVCAVHFSNPDLGTFYSFCPFDWSEIDPPWLPWAVLPAPLVWYDNTEFDYPHIITSFQDTGHPTRFAFIGKPSASVHFSTSAVHPLTNRNFGPGPSDFNLEANVIYGNDGVHLVYRDQTSGLVYHYRSVAFGSEYTLIGQPFSATKFFTAYDTSSNTLLFIYYDSIADSFVVLSWNSFTGYTVPITLKTNVKEGKSLIEFCASYPYVIDSKIVFVYQIDDIVHTDYTSDVRFGIATVGSPDRLDLDPKEAPKKLVFVIGSNVDLTVFSSGMPQLNILLSFEDGSSAIYRAQYVGVKQNEWSTIEIPIGPSASLDGWTGVPAGKLKYIEFEYLLDKAAESTDYILIDWLHFDEARWYGENEDATSETTNGIRFKEIFDDTLYSDTAASRRAIEFVKKFKDPIVTIKDVEVEYVGMERLDPGKVLVISDNIPEFALMSLENRTYRIETIEHHLEENDYYVRLILSLDPIYFEGNVYQISERVRRMEQRGNRQPAPNPAEVD